MPRGAQLEGDSGRVRVGDAGAEHARAKTEDGAEDDAAPHRV